MSSLALWSEMMAFEVRYQGWRFTFAATVVLLTAMSFIAVGTGFGPAADAVNGAFVVTETMALLSLCSVFALPMLCVHAALRDDEHGMRALVESRPVPRGTVLSVRFAGVLLLVLAALAISAVALCVAPYVLAVPSDRQVAFRIDPYMRAWWLITVPNAVWCSALLFAVAAATRSTLATFVASIAIYAGYMMTALMVDSPLMAGTRPPSPELLARSAVLDPFGLSAFFEQTRYLTPTGRTTHALSLEGHLRQNRIVVGLIALVCLAPLAAIDRRVSRGSTAPRVRWWQSAWRRVSAPTRAPRSTRATISSPTFLRVQPTTASALSWWHTMRAVATLESRVLLRSWPLLALLVMWIVVVAIEADGQLKGGDYGTRVLASTAQLADAVPEALAMLGSLCVLYFAAEVFSRERIVRVDGIRDATPAANTALLAGKTLALLVVPVLLTVTGYGTTVAMHLATGGLRIEWGVLAAHVGASLLPLVVTTCMAAALQVIIGERWLALLIGVLLALFASQGDALGVEHPLWRFGSAPALVWSDISGYGTTLRSWLAFQGLWLLGAVLLLWMAAALWSRGETQTLRTRIRHLPRLIAHGLGLRGRLGLIAGAWCFAGAAGGMWWQTTVRTPWVSSRSAMLRRVDYEQRYRALQGKAQPSIQHVEAHITLTPSHARAEIHGRLHLVNNTANAVDTLWLGFPGDVTVLAVGAPADSLIASSADPVSAAMQERAIRHAPRVFLRDGTHGMIGVSLDVALAPGDSMPLAMAVRITRGGVRADGNAIDVVENGTLLHASDVLPRMGYASARELRDSTERRRHGLTWSPSPLLHTAASEDSLRAWTRAHGQSPAWFTSSVHITTAADQIAHGPGALVSQSRSTTESRWHYRTSRPTTAAFVITSGRYAVLRASVRTARGETPVEVWHNPAHATPAARVLQVAVTSLTRLEREFGAYPHDVLRVIETPAGHRFGAYALPGSIYLTETRGMLEDARAADVDLLLRRVGHEVAHQWWGHALNPLDTDGRLLLVETMAKYAEQLLLEGTHGETQLLDMLAVDEDRYLSSRSLDEVSLLTMHDEPSLYYSKGTLAMYALRREMGDSVVRGVLRRLLDTESGPAGAASASVFERAMLDAARTPAARAAISEWLGARVLYDLVADTAVFVVSGNATRVTAQFAARRVRSVGTGAAAREVIEPLDETLLWLSARDASGNEHRFTSMARSGVVRIDTVFPVDIRSLEIDPQRSRIDRDRTNNRFTAPRK